MRFAVIAVLIALAASGCGGSGDASAPASTKNAPTASQSRVGCDVPAQCSTVQAEETLKRCPPGRLGARGRKARKRLERLLARIERALTNLRRQGLRGCFRRNDAWRRFDRDGGLARLEAPRLTDREASRTCARHPRH